MQLSTLYCVLRVYVFPSLLPLTALVLAIVWNMKQTKANRKELALTWFDASKDWERIASAFQTIIDGHVARGSAAPDTVVESRNRCIRNRKRCLENCKLALAGKRTNQNIEVSDEPAQNG